MRLLLISFFLIPLLTFAQKPKSLNYRRFDQKTIHFGFMLGGNSSDLTVYQVPDAYAKYGLKSLSNKSSAGGQVGIVSTLKLGHPVVRLRFIPTLSFQERVLNYQFVNPDTSATTDWFNEERINSTCLDFPLMLQFRTLRINNFAAYALVGGQYTVDLQSQEDAGQNYVDPFIKLRKHDWHAQVGGGVEFFAPYFKFGIELKYSHGLRNSFVNDGTVIANPIERTYNKVWWFSLIFEG